MNKFTKNIFISLSFIPFYFFSVPQKIYTYVLNLIKPGFGYFWDDFQLIKIQQRYETVKHESQNGQFFIADFFVPNSICRNRVRTFSSKEPRTLAWIDHYGGGGAFFDIGANIGLYSIYYASTKRDNVYAFEPSFFNLPLLAKNININGLSDLIFVVSNPLTSTSQFSDFSLTSLSEGSALSSFGVDYGYDGLPIDRILNYNTFGYSLDDLFRFGVLNEYPKLVKIDVDGIEPLVLKGASNILNHPSCRSVLVEVTDKFLEQKSGVKKILEETGFIRDESAIPISFKSEMINDEYNQIWVKRI